MILSKRMEKVFIDGRSEQFHPDNASGSACGAALMLSATQARIESIWKGFPTSQLFEQQKTPQEFDP